MTPATLPTLLTLALAAILCSAADSPFPAQADQGEVPTTEAGLSPFRSRLEDLRPSAPMNYFELAEDFVASDHTIEGRRLARTLFALAYELDRRVPSPIGLGPSVCLALADIADSTEEARWLIEVGHSFDRPTSGSLGQAPLKVQSGADPAASLLLAEAVNHARADEGKFARAILQRPEIAPLIPRLREALGPVERILTVGETRPHCPGCALRRYNHAAGQGIDSLDPCPVCSGNPGLRLSAEHMLITLRVEASLISVENHFWSAQILTDDGAPLREPDPAELARSYAADPARPFWRANGTPDLSGQWSSDPAAVRHATP